MLIVRVLDENFFQFHYLLPVCQEAGDPLTDGGGDGELCQFILKGLWDDGVKSGAESTNWFLTIRPWSVQMLQDEVQSMLLHHPQTCLLCRQTAGGPVRVQWRPSDKPKPVFKRFHDDRR